MVLLTPRVDPLAFVPTNGRLNMYINFDKTMVWATHMYVHSSSVPRCLNMYCLHMYVHMYDTEQRNGYRLRLD
jgi:hypothetical protein